MRHKVAVVGIGVAVLAAAGAGTGVALATGGDDSTPITGDALTKATAAALAETGGGRVTETEAGDEESAYQVEVTLADGTHVDVNLDADFKVVATKAEPADEADDDGDGND